MKTTATPVKEKTSAKSAKKNASAPQPDEDGMLPEYDFDFSRAIRNPYVGKIKPRRAPITLAPDVQAVFPDSEAVNAALRALMQAARAVVPPAPDADALKPAD